jgi:UPF0716 family protein affecting phage T7 exclusion
MFYFMVSVFGYYCSNETTRQIICNFLVITYLHISFHAIINFGTYIGCWWAMLLTLDFRSVTGESLVNFPLFEFRVFLRRNLRFFS